MMIPHKPYLHLSMNGNNNLILRVAIQSVPNSRYFLLTNFDRIDNNTTRRYNVLGQRSNDPVPTAPHIEFTLNANDVAHMQINIINVMPPENQVEIFLTHVFGGGTPGQGKSTSYYVEADD